MPSVGLGSLPPGQCHTTDLSGQRRRNYLVQILYSERWDTKRKATQCHLDGEPIKALMIQAAARQPDNSLSSISSMVQIAKSQ